MWMTRVPNGPSVKFQLLNSRFIDVDLAATNIGVSMLVASCTSSLVENECRRRVSCGMC